MVITPNQLPDLLAAFAGAWKKGACKALDEYGVEIQADKDAFQISFDLIANDGINVITRVSSQSEGTSKTITETPERTETQTQEESTSKTEAQPFVSTSTQTQVNPESKVTRVTGPRSSRTVQTSEQSVTTNEENQDNEQSSNRSNGGADTSTTVREYQSF